MWAKVTFLFLKTTISKANILTAKKKIKKSSEMCQKSNKNVSTVLNSQKCNMRSFTFDLKQNYGTTSKKFYYANIILSK